MSRTRGGSAPEGAPGELPQGAPEELFPTNNIRFVIWEVARLTERVDNISAAVDKVGESIAKGFDRHSADLKERIGELKQPMVDLRADVKERHSELKKPIEDVESDVKGLRTEIEEIGRKVAFVKGAMWVLGGLFAILLLVAAAFLRKLLE
jgi:methyl-accepting chemotaxis protein